MSYFLKKMFKVTFLPEQTSALFLSGVHVSCLLQGLSFQSHNVSITSHMIQ